MAVFDGLISYWKLDESSGDAADSFGSNTGTNTSATFTTGKIDNCASFGGSAYFDLGNPADLNLAYNNAFTINLWVKTGATSGMLFAKDGGGGGQCQYRIYINNGRFAPSVGSGTTTEIGSAINDNNRHMLTLANDGSSSVKGYIDGSYIGTGARSTDTFSTNVFIGKRTSGNGINGLIDECGVWGRELNSSEISELYNGGVGLTYTPVNTGNFLQFF